MTERETSRVSKAELAAEGATPLPDKEVLSLLDLNADLDLALDAAAPIDLALGANANIAAPIDAAVSANVLSFDSSSAAAADQGAMITQGIVGDANAEALQDSGIDQGSDLAGTGDTAGTADATALPTDGVTSTDPSTVDGALSGDLLDVNVDLNANADLAAPIDGAVAANANVAAPIDAAVSANIGSVGSDSIAVADQNVIIDQSIDGDANATADQVSDITQ